jgi:hypothetical protein
MSMIELWFVMSLVVPPAVVVVGAILMALPTRRTIVLSSGALGHAGK